MIRINQLEGWTDFAATVSVVSTMTDDLKKRVGQNLKAHRKEIGWTQAQVARAAEVDPRSVQRWERGDATPRHPELLKLARLFDTHVSEFFA